MSDVFLSYAKEDRERAARLAGVIESRGCSVWWDRHIPPGRSFDEVIEEALTAARCVVVLWSAHSVGSRWVRAEASTAAERGILVPALLEEVPIPLEFKRMQAANLVDWTGDADHDELRTVLDTIGRLVTARPAAQVLPPVREAPRRGGVLPRLSAMGLVLTVLAFTAGAALSWMLRVSSDTTSEGVSPGAAVSNGDPPSTPAAAAGPGPDATSTKGALVSAGAIAVRIGDKISDGVPRPGAGEIAAPFEHDVYTFTARPRQQVYFRRLAHSEGMGDIEWRLVDDFGMEIFGTWLNSEPGVKTLLRGGAYTMTIGSRQYRATGLYSLQLFDVPRPDAFPIKIGGRIADGVPGSGAGYIESPGAKDIYTFTAAARQNVSFHRVRISEGMGDVEWGLVDENGMKVFGTWLNTEPGVVTLVRGGTYTLTIGTDANPATGNYELEIAPAP